MGSYRSFEYRNCRAVCKVSFFYILRLKYLRGMIKKVFKIWKILQNITNTINGRTVGFARRGKSRAPKKNSKRNLSLILLIWHSMFKSHTISTSKGKNRGNLNPEGAVCLTFFVKNLKTNFILDLLGFKNINVYFLRFFEVLHKWVQKWLNSDDIS